MFKVYVSSFLLFFIAVTCSAQGSIVVVDDVTSMPVVHACLYSHNKGNIVATSTDSSGRADVAFRFDTLTVSHISYERYVLAKMTDTIRLQPKEEILAEVVVADAEPAWIKEKLRYFVKHRKGLYQTRDAFIPYSYDMRSIGDSAGYACSSVGQMYVPSVEHIDKDSMYQICPERNVVQYKDSTGMNFYVMQLMLYENVIAEMSNKFIKRHTFRVNHAYNNDGNKDVVQLVFWSDKYKEDRGTITIDTMKCAILEASRSTGLACNLDEKMNSFVLLTLKQAVGLKYNDWTIDNHIRFRQIGGAYYPSEITYKYYDSRSAYDKLAISSKKQTVYTFISNEAKLTFGENSEAVKSGRFYDIPHEIHSAILYIEPKRHSLNRQAMEKMPRTYQTFR